MTESTAHVVHIKKPAPRAKLSPAQKKFNVLIKRIARQQRRLAEWQAMMPELQRALGETYAPLRKTYNRHRVELVQILDERHADQRLSARQRARVAGIIVAICGELITRYGMDELKPLYAKHRATDCDVETAEIGDPTEGFLHTRCNDIPDRDRFRAEPGKPRQPRNKTAKQRGYESAQQEEAIQVGKSIRALYRQLVMLLHPDREQNPDEHRRKTELMQRITVAYKNQDLLQLLELQLAVTQIDQQHIDNLADDRLQHYNKVLQAQLNEIRREIERMAMMFGMIPDVGGHPEIAPAQAVAALTQAVRAIHRDIEQIQRDQLACRDVTPLKAWLKSYRVDDGLGDRMGDGLDFDTR